VTNFIVQFKLFTQTGEHCVRPSIFAKRFGRVQEGSGREIEFLKAYHKYIRVVRTSIYFMRVCQRRQDKGSTDDADTHPPCYWILRE
jgi:hypothetical protein